MFTMPQVFLLEILWHFVEIFKEVIRTEYVSEIIIQNISSSLFT